MAAKMPKGTDKVEKTMHEFKQGNLHSGSDTGPEVTDRKQAIAIGLSQQRKKEAQGHAKQMIEAAGQLHRKTTSKKKKSAEGSPAEEAAESPAKESKEQKSGMDY